MRLAEFRDACVRIFCVYLLWLVYEYKQTQSKPSTQTILKYDTQGVDIHTKYAKMNYNL